MIGKRYEDAKIAVLDVCERYLRFRGDTEDGVDVNSLKTRVKEVKDGRYVLAVVGEVSAGKSTLINALLGEHVLPTGVLQTSSAIVEICKSERKYVEVCYADGRSQTVYDDPSTPDLDEAAEYLRQLGAVKDEYQSSQEYEKGQSSTDIPIKITLGFPLKYAFDGLRLVDSPGVNAIGGFQDATHEYIREANAVLFVRSIDSPVESIPFRNFVNEVVPEHTRETLFLVLTKSGKNSSEAIAMTVKKARGLYAEEINRDRILHVDSLLKIVSDEIKEFDSAASLKEHYRQQEQDCKAEKRSNEASTFEDKRRLLNNVLDNIGDDSDHETVQSELRKLSNFDGMERLIDDFSSRAPWLQLSGLLDSVKIGYDNQTALHEQNLAAWEKKKKSPQTFENEISEIQSRLNEYRDSMNYFVEKVKQDFTGRKASKASKAPKVLYNEKREQIRNEHLKRLRSATSLDTAKRELESFYNAMCSLGDDVVARIRTRFEEESKRLGEEFEAKHHIKVPTIDISTIDSKAKEEAYDKYDAPRKPKGFWEWTQKIFSFGIKEFKERGTKYSPGKHLSSFKSKTSRELEERAAQFPELMSSLVADFTKSFQSDLKTLIDSRTRVLEDIKKSKAENAQILANIAATKQKKKDIATEVTQINDILGDIR